MFYLSNKCYMYVLTIHRIFYVSHDSQDLQIFSFISKEDDVFRCNVFKASSKVCSSKAIYVISLLFSICNH